MQRRSAHPSSGIRPWTERDQPRAHLEPHVPVLSPALTDDDPSGAPDRAAPLRRAGLANILQPIRERKAAGMADADPSER
jgi:hypothetical protein